MSLIEQIINVESGGNPNAKNPRSSAFGPSQFLTGTWLDMLSRYRPDLTTGRSRDELLALRSDPDLSKAMTAAYASENARKLQESGLPVTPGSTYLAHFAGPKGAVGIMSADPSAPVAGILGEAAVESNPFLKNMTVADLRVWADTKMGGEPMQSAQPAMPMPGQQQGMGSLAGLMPQAPQGNPMMSMFGSMAPQESEEPQPPPMPVPIRRPIDLSRLRAALQQAPSPGAFSLGG